MEFRSLTRTEKIVILVMGLSNGELWCSELTTLSNDKTCQQTSQGNQKAIHEIEQRRTCVMLLDVFHVCVGFCSQMTTLDDKLLGEKRDNYCSSSSSSEDEGTNDNDQEGRGRDSPSSGLDKRSEVSRSKIDINSTNRWEGYSQNTGPKGVIRDWQLYKEHEARVRKDNERKLCEDMKRHSVTCASYNDDVLRKRKEAAGTGATAGAGTNDDTDIDELLMDDSVLEEFVRKRMETMVSGGGTFHRWSGSVLEIENGDEFLKVVDEAGETVTVVIHIYDQAGGTGTRNRTLTARVNDCLDSLSSSHPGVQFCKVGAGTVGVSQLFRAKGTPALLVYKAGNLIGNFVSVGEELGDDEFCAGDLENFLIERGVLSEGVGVGGQVPLAGKNIK